MSRTEVEMAFLESALEQVLESRAADVPRSDDRRRNASSRRAFAPIAAALAVAVVGAIWALGTDEFPAGEHASPGSEQTFDPDFKSLVSPSSLDELRAFLQRVDRAQARVNLARLREGVTVPLRVVGEPDAPVLELPWSTVEREALLAAFVDDDASQGYVADGSHQDLPNRVEFALGDGRYFALDVVFVASSGQWIIGSGRVGMRFAHDLDAWLARIHAAAEPLARSKGVFHPAMLPFEASTNLPTSLRLHEFARSDLSALGSLASATRLDLRYSPGLHDGSVVRAGELASLRELKLDAHRTHGDLLRAVADAAPRLTTLLLLPRDQAYWSVSASGGGSRETRTEFELDALSRWPGLQHLATTFGELDAKDLSVVCGLRELRTWSASGCRLRDGIGRVERLASLEELYLQDCEGLRDRDFAAIAKCASLQRLDLAGSRNAAISAESVRALAASESLHRLDLSGWFRREAADQASAWPPAWRGAIESLLGSSSLRWLALVGCDALTLDDVRLVAATGSLDVVVLGDNGPLDIDVASSVLLDARPGMTVIID